MATASPPALLLQVPTICMVRNLGGWRRDADRVVASETHSRELLVWSRLGRIWGPRRSQTELPVYSMRSDTSRIVRAVDMD